MGIPGNPGRRDPTAREGRHSAAHGPSAGTGRPQGTAAPDRTVPLAHNAGPRMAGRSGKRKSAHPRGQGWDGTGLRAGMAEIHKETRQSGSVDL